MTVKELKDFKNYYRQIGFTKELKQLLLLKKLLLKQLLFNETLKEERSAIACN